MSTKFEERPRFTLAEAIEICKRGGFIRHILNNGDGTYSVMGHINCEHCDYCDENNEWWEQQKKMGLSSEQISNLDERNVHTPKADPYEIQKKKYPENYGLA